MYGDQRPAGSHSVVIDVESNVNEEEQPRLRRRDHNTVPEPVRTASLTGNHSRRIGQSDEPVLEENSSPSVDSAQYLRKKRLCNVVDAVGILWRTILPIPLWLTYFVQGYGGELFPVAYLCFKMMSASWQAKACFEFLGNVVLGKLV